MKKFRQTVNSARKVPDSKFHPIPKKLKLWPHRTMKLAHSWRKQQSESSKLAGNKPKSGGIWSSFCEILEWFYRTQKGCGSWRMEKWIWCTVPAQCWLTKRHRWTSNWHIGASRDPPKVLLVKNAKNRNAQSNVRWNLTHLQHGRSVVEWCHRRHSTSPHRESCRQSLIGKYLENNLKTNRKSKRQENPNAPSSLASKID